MKKLLLILTIAFINPVFASELCTIIAGATIVSKDGKYLGKISSKYDSDSILNVYGAYGSKYNSDSIWNEYGMYGGKYSSDSPFNPYSSTPPFVIKDGEKIAHLTVNKNLESPLNPYVIKSCTFY
jgi:hypothetical protein